MRPEDAPRPARVSLVLHTFDRGGSGRVAAHLARGFADGGLDARLIVLARGGVAEASIMPILGPAPPVRFLGRPSGSRAVDLVARLLALVRELRDHRPDVVVASANNVALATAAALRSSGLHDARLFLKTTNPIASSRHRGVARAVRRGTYGFAFGRAEGVLTLSDDETAEMDAAFPAFRGLFRTVANPYVTPAMSGGAPMAKAAAGPKVVCVARLEPQKRIDRLIAAFAEVGTPGARLLVLGEGAERPSLEAQVARLGLGGRVSLPGFSDHVAWELRSADLSVLTSAYEGLPAAVLESMAAGCPVLCTDCFCAARSLLGSAPGCGVVEDASPAALSARIDWMLAAPRPTGLEAVAARYSVAAGVADHRRAIGV